MIILWNVWLAQFVFKRDGLGFCGNFSLTSGPEIVATSHSSLWLWAGTSGGTTAWLVSSANFFRLPCSAHAPDFPALHPKCPIWSNDVFKPPRNILRWISDPLTTRISPTLPGPTPRLSFPATRDEGIDTAVETVIRIRGFFMLEHVGTWWSLLDVLGKPNQDSRQRFVWKSRFIDLRYQLRSKTQKRKGN